MFYSYLISCLFIVSLTAVTGDLSSDITRCQGGDNACFKKTAQHVMNKYFAGLKDLNLFPFDPLRVKSLTLARNAASPVNIDLKFKNLDLIGLKAAQVKQVKGLNFKERSLFEALVPELLLKGDYTSDGQVLILPVKGHGRCVITCKNLLLKYTFDLKQVKKNDKVYAELEHVKLEIKPELVHFNFEGLFNNDKALGDNMNKFLNENWRDIYAELEGSFTTGLSLIVKQMINNVLGSHPYDNLIIKGN